MMTLQPSKNEVTPAASSTQMETMINAFAKLEAKQDAMSKKLETKEQQSSQTNELSPPRGRGFTRGPYRGYNRGYGPRYNRGYSQGYSSGGFQRRPQGNYTQGRFQRGGYNNRGNRQQFFSNSYAPRNFQNGPNKIFCRTCGKFGHTTSNCFQRPTPMRNQQIPYQQQNQQGSYQAPSQQPQVFQPASLNPFEYQDPHQGYYPQQSNSAYNQSKN